MANGLSFLLLEPQLLNAIQGDLTMKCQLFNHLP